MRQIKKFMEAKRPMWNCNECKCITIQCWKENDAFCGCGEWGSPLPPLHNEIHQITENSAATFGENNSKNFIEISIETDLETGDSRVFTYPHWVFADERYVMQEWYTVWDDTIGMMDTEAVKKVIYNYNKWPSKIFEVLNEVYKNPTDENIQAATDVIWQRIPRDELQNTIEATSENSAELFYDWYNKLDIEQETDAETWLPRVVISPQGDFDSEWFEMDGENIWSSVFTDETWTNMKYWIDWATEFPSDVFTTLNAVCQDPTAENIQAANNAIIWWKPTIINKALGGYEDGTYMFVGPDLYNGSYIRVNLETDPEEWDTRLVVEWFGMFDPEWTYWESANLLIWAFETMGNERILHQILWVSWLSPYISDLWTINSDCMSLVQAIYNNPTEANQQALVTFWQEWEVSPEQNPLIVDDDQSSRIIQGLEGAEPTDVQAVITRSDEGGQSWEPLVVEDYYTYYLSATSENGADVEVYVWDYMYRTSVTVETDQETEESRVVVGECFPSPLGGA